MNGLPVSRPFGHDLPHAPKSQLRQTRDLLWPVGQKQPLPEAELKKVLVHFRQAPVLSLEEHTWASLRERCERYMKERPSRHSPGHSGPASHWPTMSTGE